MKRIIFLLILFCSVGMFSFAQQKLEHNKMSYLVMAKPNVIIYHDSVFNGVKQFEQLFYRKYDSDLIEYLSRHQSNKITGQIMAFSSGIVTAFGVSALTTSGGNRALGWSLVGGGIGIGVLGAYLTTMGQRNLLTAITLFNQRYGNASLKIGLSERGPALVYKF